MNKRTLIKFILGFFLSLMVVIIPQWMMTSAQSSVNLTISAAASLRQVMEEIQTAYGQNKSNVRLNYNFGSSGSLQRQIEQGAPVDIFFSAATKQMDALQTKDRIVAETRKNLLSNQIVLIAPNDKNMIQEFADLTKADVKRIAIGEPKSVPAGEYSKQVLDYYQIWQRIEPKMIFGKDVRSVLAYIESGNVDAGLVYATDAKISDKVKVIGTAPSQSYQSILYPVAVIKDSKKMEESQAFIQFLASSQAQKIFEKYGFEMN